MKIWSSYGSEHSANLVMIGHFKDSASAEETSAAIDELRSFASDSENNPQPDRYSEKAMALLSKLKFHSVGSSELEQFNYDFSTKVKGTTLVIKTEEIEVSALMKLMIDRGARVEIYSAHIYPDTEHGRGKG
jgi:hypothetical protein